MDLNTIWFLLLGVLLTGYAVLDGFDLGVGVLHLFAREERERKTYVSAIGPVWDGNEVWLVTGGGALFAAFPPVYATVLSGFYLPIILLLFALIFRAVAIEFRSKQPMAWWRSLWDGSFCAASVLASLLFGVALGNVIRGIPLDARGEYTGGVLELLNPYALLVGVTTVALFAMHGAIYLVLRTEGELQARVSRWVPHAIAVFAVTYVATTIATLLYVPHMTEPFREHPLWLAVPLATLLAIADVPREIHAGRPGRAFVASCLGVLGLWALVGIGMFPNLVTATDPARSLSLHDTSSSPLTLRVMTVIAAIGVPLVLAYTVAIYWVFRGKVRLDASSY